MLLNKLEKARYEAEFEMYAGGNELVTRAQMEVPVDTGALQSSGTVEVPIRKGEKSEMEVYFGDTGIMNPEHGRATSTYAMDQHENLTYSHNIGKAHYLTDPLNRIKDTIKNRVRRAFVRGLKS